ncbi:LAQU0S04e02938g1_1 [Lachancea quebecensis]|uniref:LAQU0S04e02938g1_1 n=1 Tax=Lachancea quebecensis TaxID=1654605 RepID=A0A0P1KPC9_9SACH|nr:LAQU0S04e02938g1_1 [Lachancea quebecensis]
MEKFTNWRDKGTGIAPFLPTPPPLAQEKGLKGFLGGLSLALKLTLAFPIVLVALLLKWTPVYRPMWKAAVKLVFAWKLQVSVQGVKSRKQGPQFMPTKGKVYVVNYTSPLDPLALWLIARGPVAFCVPNSRRKTISLNRLSLWDLVKFTLGGSTWDSTQPDYQEVKSAMELSNYVTYIFAEGTTSNGKSVLPFVITQQFWNDFLGEPTVGSSSSVKAPSSVATRDAEVRAVHIKINGSLTTPLRVNKWRYLARASSQGVTYKCRISEPLGHDLEKTRVALCGGDKFKLVGKELNTESKMKFAVEYGSRRR